MYFVSDKKKYKISFFFFVPIGLGLSKYLLIYKGHPHIQMWRVQKQKKTRLLISPPPPTTKALVNDIRVQDETMFFEGVSSFSCS